MTNNIRLYGDSPYRVAVIHGGPGAPGSVAAVARALSRGCGVLEPLQTECTLEGQVQELRQALLRHGMPPVTLIGHSWGAWLAYMVAARYPDLVGKLILVSSAPFAEAYVGQLHQARLSRLDSNEQTEFQELLERLAGPNAGDKSALLARLGSLVAKSDDVDVITIPTDTADAVATDGDQYQTVWAEAAQMRKSGALSDMARSISCPVVAIHGDFDPHPALGVKEPLERVLQRFRFVLLDRCGHSPWKERYASERFYAVLREEL